MKEITREMCQDRALGQYLCEWGDMPYSQVMEILETNSIAEDEDGDSIITIWEAVEGLPGEQIAEYIKDYYDSICRFVGIES